MSGRLQLRASNLEWRAVEGEIVALDISGSEYLAVNAAGKILWDALASGTSRAALVELLIDGYAIERAVAERDTDAFVAELQRRGLLEQPA